MRLLVGDHLQAVLEAAQDIGRPVQFGASLGLDPAALRECREPSSVGAHAQVRLPAAGDQLLRLHEELDLADAAAPELEVMAGTAMPPIPLWAWIWRFIAWMSAMAAKSRYLRQTNGDSSLRNLRRPRCRRRPAAP